MSFFFFFTESTYLKFAVLIELCKFSIIQYQESIMKWIFPRFEKKRENILSMVCLSWELLVV